MTDIDPGRSGMASGILSSQRALGSTAGFAVMGSILALVVSAQLPTDLEATIPDASERASVVAEVEDAASPQAVPSVIAPAASDSASDAINRSDVIEAADDAFVSGIRLAELSGALLALLALILGWVAFPRSQIERPEPSQ